MLSALGKLPRSLMPWGDLAGRLFLAQLFIMEGLGKLDDYAAAQAYMSHHDVPMLLLPPAIAVELIGGFFILSGWQTRITAAVLAGFCLAAAVIFHSEFADRGEVIHFEKDLALAGAFFILSARGAGRFSFDAWRRGDKV